MQNQENFQQNQKETHDLEQNNMNDINNVEVLDALNPSDPSNTNEELQKIQELEKLQEQLQNTQHSFLLARADLENQKKRHQDELEKVKKFAIEGFAGQLVNVMDALSAALADPSENIENIKKGVELTHKQLHSCFERFKITEIDGLGQIFDPSLHQVISTQASQEAPHTIIQVLQKGYKIQERLLRPAMVITASAAE